MPLLTPITTTEPPELGIPSDILAVIPTDPFDQLDLARKITSMAIASRVSNLESEVGSLREMLEEKERVVNVLGEKAGRLEKACSDADAKLRTVMDENVKLSIERDALAMTNKKLGRDLSKLEAFKRQLMQSLNEDESSQAETVDIGTCDQTVPKVNPYRDENSNHNISRQPCNSSGDAANTIEASRYTAQKFSITPYITPRLTPTGTPKITSTAGSPRAYSAAVSPTKTSGITTPARFSYEGWTTKTSCYSSSQQSSAANSPPRARPVPARTARIDGKEFFRQARSRLSYEQFSAFLATIKDLNARKQTREETLKKAEEIFGVDNKDLYISFQALLNRSIQ